MRGPRFAERACAACGGNYTPRHSRQRTCGENCRVQLRTTEARARWLARPVATHAEVCHAATSRPPPIQRLVIVGTYLRTPIFERDANGDERDPSAIPHGPLPEDWEEQLADKLARLRAAREAR